MQNETTADDRGYRRDYVELPEVEEGDRVRVAYVSGQNASEQERTGEVVEVHANGFTFVHESGDEGYATSVRDHEDKRVEEYRNDPPIRRRLGTVVWEERSEENAMDSAYVHAAELNRRHESPDEVEVVVL